MCYTGSDSFISRSTVPSAESGGASGNGASGGAAGAELEGAADEDDAAVDLQSQLLLAELRVQRQLLVLQVLRERHREELDLCRICSLWCMCVEVSPCRRGTCRDCTSNTSSKSAEHGR